MYSKITKTELYFFELRSLNLNNFLTATIQRYVVSLMPKYNIISFCFRIWDFHVKLKIFKFRILWRSYHQNLSQFYLRILTQKQHEIQSEQSLNPLHRIWPSSSVFNEWTFVVVLQISLRLKWCSQHICTTLKSLLCDLL